MAKKYHPDAGDETVIGKFHEVAEAYKVLSDPALKKVYDLSLGVDLPKKTEVKMAPAPSDNVERGKPREGYRDDELREFHQNRYRKAWFRVIGFSLLLGVIGSFLAFVLGGIILLGGLAGALIGFDLSLHKNFDLKSFFDSKKKYRLSIFFTWVALLLGFGYFVWLMVRGFIKL